MFKKIFYLTFLFLNGFSSAYSNPNDNLIPFYPKSINQIKEAFSFHFINDNYIATWLPGEEGHYFGADDFITGTFLANYYYGVWQHNLTFSALTLRRFNLRYDLLSIISTKRFWKHDYNFDVGGGLMLKGELGGDSFQNGYHKFRAIKRVDIPYSNNKGLGIILSATGAWKNNNLLLDKDFVQILLETKIYTNHISSYITPKVSYQAAFWDDILRAEILMAYRGYLNSVHQYSKMVRSGVFYGMNVKINVYENYYLDVGFITLPTRNIESDPQYPKYKNNYLPQAWIGFSWRTGGFGISDFIPY